MSRVYLDYNATSPLANNVKSFLAQGDMPYSNPSSFHTAGKAARKQINQTTQFLLKSFQLPGHEVLYHSGATEFVNTLFGPRLNSINSTSLKDTYGVFYFPSDHPCVIEAALRLQSMGADVFELPIDCNGNFDLDSVVEQIKDYQDSTGKKALLNFTWVHNETGVIWPLSLAKKIKSLTSCLIHVDAVQSVAKVEDFLELSDDIDYYTYSAHKFGALKSIGFTFIKKDSPFTALIIGGGQQSGRRAGTENTLGVMTIKLALEELIEKFDYQKAMDFKQVVEEKIINILGDKGKVIGKNCSFGRNCNTINFVLNHKKADVSLIQFDMHGIDVSSGSACSVQSLKDSPTLVAMGETQLASHSIRLSMGPYDYLSPEKFDPVYDVISKLVK